MIIKFEVPAVLNLDLNESSLILRDEGFMTLCHVNDYEHRSLVIYTTHAAERRIDVHDPARKALDLLCRSGYQIPHKDLFLSLQTFEDTVHCRAVITRSVTVTGSAKR